MFIQCLMYNLENRKEGCNLPACSIEHIKEAVSIAADEYNAEVSSRDQIASISVFGSYAEGRATETSDVDLLVRFASAVVSLFTLAKVMVRMEERLGISVDIIQDPIPEGSLITINARIPIYERI